MIIAIAVLFTVGLSAAMINATLEEIAQYLREIAKRKRTHYEN